LVNVPLAYVEWIVTMVVGVGLGFAINPQFGFTMLALWVMGCIYNIPPIRSKDLPYLDVLSESINNPLRMLAGWYVTGIDAFAPTSLLLSYWMVGCYFMALKRYAEYNEIDDPERAASYRASFSYYTPERLLVSVMFYASAAMLFLGAFIMRYRLELILSFPLIAIVMAIYFSLAFEADSAAINPEKLWREPRLMIAVTACAVVMLVLLFVDIPALDTVFRPTGLRVRT
jgi:4-hydroxybenzoate polyprenyltransferase